jgi:hypothetical protein
MKVLLYGNRKMDPIAYDASTPESELQAFLRLFRYFDGEFWDMYKASPPASKQQQALYDAAKTGDANAAKKLLTLRRTYEYEEWQLIDVQPSEAAEMFRQASAEEKDA